MTDIVNIEMYNNLVIENELLKKKNIELEEKLKAHGLIKKILKISL